MDWDKDICPSPPGRVQNEVSLRENVDANFSPCSLSGVLPSEVN